jgi:hypothetical protein
MIIFDMSSLSESFWYAEVLRLEASETEGLGE